MLEIIKEHREKFAMLGLLPLCFGIGMLMFSTSIDAGRANTGLVMIVIGTVMVIPLVVFGGKEVIVATEIFNTDYKTPMLKFPEFFEQLQRIEDKMKTPISLEPNVTKKAGKVIGLKIVAGKRVIAYVTINSEGEYVITSAQQKVLDAPDFFSPAPPYPNGRDDNYMGLLNNTLHPKPTGIPQ